MKFKAYHKIKQFKDIVRDVKHLNNYKGEDENGKPIFEKSDYPILTFKGTVKLHGTNAGICYTPEKGVIAQKRSSLIGKEQLTAHFGFNQFVQVINKEYLTNLMSNLYNNYGVTPGSQLILFGEWAGIGVQKNVGISELEKSFYAFDLLEYNPETEEERWLNISETFLGTKEENRISNIHTYETFEVNIDFNVPGEVQNMLGDITNKVEEKCPVASFYGKDGVGEGVVWTSFYKNQKLIFKVKGKKHSVSKVKKLANVDPEVLNNIIEFVEYACTENRIEQGIKEVNAVDKRNTPDLLRWIANDIISEESDTLEANNLEWKDVAKEVSHKARNYFFKQLEKV